MSRYINLYDEDIILRVVIAFLYEGKSHRQIQREVLGLPAPARGGGFIVMDILHHFGIDGSKKGILSHQNINEEISNSSGTYCEVLKKVMEYHQMESEVKRNLEERIFKADITTTEINTITKNRINQSALRNFVLSNYNNRCALCEIDKPDLLVCSHIKPWAIDSENRLNPSNAICLCVLHDKLFDRGYFSLDRYYRIIFGSRADQSIRKLFEGLNFRVPANYPPDFEFLNYHFNEICK